MWQSMFWLLLSDVVFLAVLAVLVAPLCMTMRATYAVLKRNFIGYFSNPTGYVFLCLFVLLTSFAAFWPHEFFNANLATLDQLNKYLPLIMLVFIPAITMSIWAEERRQGTDELLLTLPAGDFDIVVGKYLAAAAIFTASLLFSQLSNFVVLDALTVGDLDTGLFFSTYLGYWLVGMSMLSVGMVASFLTGNLTVGFILGAAFNAPLVFAARADVIFSSGVWARAVASYSMGSQFDDFGRGVVSLSSTAFFVLVIIGGLYLSMVLIGRRHWSGGRDGTSMLGHYLVRTICLAVIVVATSYFLSANTALSNVRGDLTRGKVGSLSPKTRELLGELKPEHRIKIEAFVSGQVPELYAKTRADLISLLKEFRATAGEDVDVQIHTLDENREESVQIAAMAEERYGIKPQPVRTRSRGAIKDDNIFLAAAFTCGLEKVVVPFFDYGIPAEYELVRSICTVAKKERKKIGVVRTEAQLFGGFSMAGGRPQQMPKQAIIEELEKQYDVKEIDPASPIEEAFAVMIVVQPSSLNPDEFNNVVEAVRNGQPTAIFEDPRPIFMGMAPATGEPKRPPMGGMMGMMGGGGPQPKGDIQKLWNVLGIEVPGQPGQNPMQPLFEPDLAWQRYNPYQKLQIQGIPDSWVFCRREAPGGQQSINEKSPITAGLTEIFFPVPGVIRASKNSDLTFTRLVSTGEFAGTMTFKSFMENQDNPLLLQAKEGRPKGAQTIAARIQGKPAADKNMSDAGSQAVPAAPQDVKPAIDPDGHDHAQDEGSKAAKSEGKDGAKKPAGKPAKPIDVVYVADIDLMISTFLRIRARPGEDEEISWKFENVTFLLNIFDVLAGQEDFIEIRNRKPYHSTLKMVEARTQQANDRQFDEKFESQEKYDREVKDIEKKNTEEVEKFRKKLDELQDKQRQEGQVGIKLAAELQKAAQDLAAKQEQLNRQLEVKREQLKRERDEKVGRIQRNVDLEILAIKSWYKFLAVALPPIPPLLIGLVVFVQRRLREREGVAKSRLR